jgi:hypothetical protein
MWWVSLAWADPTVPPTPSVQGTVSEPGGNLPLVRGQVPEEALYDKIADLGDGRVEGRSRRRRDGSYALWELPASGTVVRYEALQNGKVAEEHLMDAAGYPLATVFFADGAPQKATVTGSTQELALTGWTRQKVPGGTALLPAAPQERSGGGARADALGGTVDVWIEPTAADPFSDPFRDGLLAGCGCFVVDRASAWIDGRAGVRYRLLLPGAAAAGGPARDAVDLWAVSLGAQGVWLMSFRATAPPDPVAALAPGRVVAALVDLE